MKKFDVNYTLSFHASVEVEAETAEDAEEKVNEMLDTGKLGNVCDMECAGREVEVSFVAD
jgi:hypothetical protein